MVRLSLSMQKRAPQIPAHTNLLAATVESRLHLPARLRHVALLQEREVMRVLEGDLQLLVLCLLQRIQKVIWKTS